MNDEIFDTQIGRALAVSSGEIAPATEMLNRIRVGRIKGGRAARTAFSIAIAVAAVGIGSGVAAALGLLHTVPTQVHVTKPGESAPFVAMSQHCASISQPPLPADASPWGPSGAPVTAYGTSLANAKAVAGFPVLTLDPGVGILQSVTVLPGQGGCSAVQLVYLVNGTTVEVIENPAESGSSLQISVKSYGAAETHEVTADGYNLVYHGQTPDSVNMVMFQTTGGTIVFISSGSSAGPGPSPGLGSPLSLDQYVSLIQGMS